MNAHGILANFTFKPQQRMERQSFCKSESSLGNPEDGAIQFGNPNFLRTQFEFLTGFPGSEQSEGETGLGVSLCCAARLLDAMPAPMASSKARQLHGRPMLTPCAIVGIQVPFLVRE
jgi:hypothetical protein